VRPDCHHPGCTEPVGRGRKHFCGAEHALDAERARKRRYRENHPRDRRTAVDVDRVAVERAVEGHPITLTQAERKLAARILDRRGMSSRQVATQIGTSRRTVVRYRTARRQERTA
jgi:FixJ family two-component response regulator